MLVLTRIPGEGIVLTLPDGQRVTLTVVSVDRGKVRLNVVAPRTVPVYRGELLAEDDPRRTPDA